MSMRPKPPPRRVWYKVWENFRKSFSFGYIRASSEGGGKYIGSDYMGTKYYEKPADPDRGRLIPTRYFEVQNPDDYCQENLPSEWDSWLRSRRREPPTDEEVARNLQIAAMKKENARRLALQRGESIEPLKPTGLKFPVYEEYEVNPGQLKRQS